MADAKTLLVSTLKNNAALSALLGGPYVFYEFPDTSVDIGTLSAWVIYYEIENKPVFADGREYFIDAAYQVDVFSRKTTTKIAKAVNAALSAVEFERQQSSDTVEEDGDQIIFRKATQYRIMMEV